MVDLRFCVREWRIEGAITATNEIQTLYELESKLLQGVIKGDTRILDYSSNADKTRQCVFFRSVFRDLGPQTETEVSAFGPCVPVRLPLLCRG